MHSNEVDKKCQKTKMNDHAGCADGVEFQPAVKPGRPFVQHCTIVVSRARALNAPKVNYF